jgi:leucyl aminopeptidase (aminopeptidase T)
MTPELQRTAKEVMQVCLGVQKGDKVAIVCDSERLGIADAMAVIADELQATAIILTITEGFRKTKTITKGSLNERLLEVLRDFDLIVLLLAQIGEETPFRAKFVRLSSQGVVRVANLPGITEKGFIEDIKPPDKETVERIGNEMARILRRAKKVRVTSLAGTDIAFELYNRGVQPEISSGFILQPSIWGNLPGAEVYIAPKVGSAEGRIVVDCTFPRGHLLKTPISFEMRQGKVVRDTIQASDKTSIDLLNDVLRKPNCDLLAEFGIGLNKEIKVLTGIVLIDEKMYGTAHFALGDNVEFGGEIKADDHFDMVFQKPSVWADEDQIMKNGEFIYDADVLKNNYKYFPGTLPPDTFVRTASGVSCKRDNGHLMLLWRGGANRLHTFMIGDEETNLFVVKVWSALDHGGNEIQALIERTGLDKGIVTQVIELMIDYKVLEEVERTKRSVETLEDMLKSKKYQSTEPLSEDASFSLENSR